MSLTAVMDALVNAEEAALTGRLNMSRWWPPNTLPALWHWLPPSEVSQKDMCHLIEQLRVDVFVATDPRVHAGHDMVALEGLVEVTQGLLITQLYAARPLGGAAQSARWLGTRDEVVQFGDVGALCKVLTIEAAVEHVITPGA